MVLDKISKAVVLLKFVHKIKDVLNRNPDFIQSTKDINYSYFIKVMDNEGQEINKFTIGLKEGQMSISPNFKPDIIMTMTENAFFGIIKGNMTLEESYFSGETDIWAKDGQWSVHLPGIKNVFDRIQQSVKNELGEI